MLRTLVILAGIVLGCTLLAGQELVPVGSQLAAQSAVCRVSAVGQGFQCWGTGVLMNSGCVLTASHTFREGGSPRITWSDGSTTAATISARDDTYDLLMLEPARVPAGMQGYPRAGRNMQPGDMVYTAGYGGPGDVLQVLERRVQGYSGPGSGPPDWLFVSGPSRQGDSGGPILTPSGEVVGIVWGTDGASYSTGGNTGRTQLLCQACIRCRPRIWSPRTTGPPQYQVVPQMPAQPPPIPLPLPPTVEQPPPPENCVTSGQLAAAIAALQVKIDAIKAQPGLEGPAGTQGLPGPPGQDGAAAQVDVVAVAAAVVQVLKQDAEFIAACKGAAGPSGSPGADAVVDLPALVAAVEAKLKPFRFISLNLDGSVRDDVLARLGDIVKIRPVIVKAEGK